MGIRHSLTNIRTTTLLLAALASLFLTYRVVVGLFYPSAESKATELSTESILNSINRERGNRNLVLLNTNSKLMGAADYKAHDMVTRKYFSHTDPEGQYIWSKIVALGYAPYTMLGENLAIEFYSTESLVQAWMDSPTHRANILQEGFRDQGMGLAYGSPANGEFGTSIANIFGTLLPKKSTAPATPAQVSKKPAPAPVKKTPAVKKPAPKKTLTQKVAKVTAPVKAAEIRIEQAVEEIKNLDPITPRGVATAVLPLFPHPEESSDEPSFQTGQDVQPPAVPETPAPTSVAQEIPATSTNPYSQYRLWAIIVAVSALGLLALEAKKFVADKIHIPRHRWNTILMLILTLLVTAVAYVI